MPQLQINQGPQDALLYDNSRSYFKQIGYSRTSNFQLEYRDIDPANTANLGATAQFVLPKCADLLGNVDLMIDFDKMTNTTDFSNLCTTAGEGVAVGWVESLGYAVIDYMTFSVGSHECERITGDQMYIINELMRADKERHADFHVMKTGRPLLNLKVESTTTGGALASTAGTTVPGAISPLAATKTAIDALTTLSSTADIVPELKKLVAAGAFTSAAGTCTVTSGTVSNATISNTVEPIVSTDTSYNSGNRLIYYFKKGSGAASTNTDTVYDGKKLCIPLNFFFTKSADKYFPMCAIAGSHDVRISIKFRPLSELIQIRPIVYPTDISSVSHRMKIDGDGSGIVSFASKLPDTKIAQSKCKLRCTYVHVTGPEATDLMNAEQVRLMRQFMTHSVPKALTAGTEKKPLWDIELPFLHPVQELIIVIRKQNEMNDSTTTVLASETNGDASAMTKSRFSFQGGGKDPNIDSLRNIVMDGSGGGAQDDLDNSHLLIDNFKLTLNGQERHPSLASEGLSRDYLLERVVPPLHSNSSKTFHNLIKCHSEHALDHGADKVADHSLLDFRYLEQMMDRKEIYVYPFCIAPESMNPSGAVNFSKVSHARLKIEGIVTGNSQSYVCDIHALHYNWLSIKDGRAITSFA